MDKLLGTMLVKNYQNLCENSLNDFLNNINTEESLRIQELKNLYDENTKNEVCSIIYLLGLNNNQLIDAIIANRYNNSNFNSQVANYFHLSCNQDDVPNQLREKAKKEKEEYDKKRIIDPELIEKNIFYYRTIFQDDSTPTLYGLYKNDSGFRSITNSPELLKFKDECQKGTINDLYNKLEEIKVTDRKVALQKLLKKIFDLNDGSSKIINSSKNSVVLNGVEKVLDDFINKGFRQIILTGAPGTGKTYDVREYSEKNGSLISTLKGNDKKYEFIQFHSSYDYSDFVEGIRPVDDNNGGMKFVKIDGIFKRFCRNVVKLNEDWLNSLDENEKAKKSPDDNEKLYFFIIDEINRADLGKVFGELMFGLEESYRGKKNAFPTQYNNLRTHGIDDKEKDCFGEGFYIPKNIVIIGTMNDIDRSVEAFDFALRRRFQWFEVKVKDVMWKVNDMRKGDSEDFLSALKERINMLNNVINGSGEKFFLNTSYNLGPAYFKKTNKNKVYEINDLEEECETIWKFRAEPILKEYCRSFNSKSTDNFIVECYKAFVFGQGVDNEAEISN